jgi:endonuclease G
MKKHPAWNSVLVDEQTQRATERFTQATVNWKRYREVLASRKPVELAKPERLEARIQQLDPQDTLAFERVCGRSDLFPIAYLEKGLNVGRSVCRLEIRDSIGKIHYYGTGFLVSPSLIITNNHVIDTEDSARYSLAYFNYQDDLDHAPCAAEYFRLNPDAFFETSRDLDFTLVAVEPLSRDGTSLSDFGFLPLIPEPGKVLDGEYVSIIQHPSGAPKAVSVRENQVVGVAGNYLHYVTDTEPGSSGSPVFSDDWKVVALHHAGVKDPDDDTKYIANEGVRVSAIVTCLADRKTGWSAEKGRFIDELLAVAGHVPQGPVPAKMTTEMPGVERYTGSSGYDPAFLGEGHEIPLPVLRSDLTEDMASSADGSPELKYTHFSVVMSRSRRLAYYTAVNIDGSRRVDVPRDSDAWYYDPRIDRCLQCGPELYEANDLDQGHLVRRLDPVWGEDAMAANDDTFHFTNCSPQHRKLNRESWLGLEEYILDNAGKHDIRVTVFTGPVFRDDDIVYRGQYRIPAEFWKVVAMTKDDGTLSATAYLQTQKNLISDLEFAYGEYQTYQMPIATIEKISRLDFGDLRSHDPLASIEATAGRLIERSGDIRL